MAEGDRPTRYCGQCGARLQEGDSFCGVCGFAVLPPTPQADQVIPKPVAAVQGVAHGGRRRRRALVNGAMISLMALLVVGGVAAFALNDGPGLLGGSDRSSSNPSETPPVQEPGASTPPSSGSSYEDKEDAILEEFARSYDAAARREDWAETYSMLIDSSQDEFTEEEWAQAQRAIVETDGLPAPLRGVTVDQNEEVTDVPARVTLYYEDGAEETIVAGIPMVVEDESDSGVPKRTLTEEEVEDLEALLVSDVSEPEEDAEAEAFVSDYYEAVGREDWQATYSMLAEVSQEVFTEAEWIEAQQARQAQEGAPPPLQSVEAVNDGEFSSSAAVTFEDGSTTELTILYYPQTGELGRLLSEEDVSYLRSLTGEGTSATDEEVAVEETIRSHYEAIGEGDFEEAYSYFGPTFRATNGEDDWIAEEESYDITDSTINSVEVVSVSGDAAQAEVDVSFEDNTGTSEFYLGWALVKENEEWKLDQVSDGGETN